MEQSSHEYNPVPKILVFMKPCTSPGCTNIAIGIGQLKSGGHIHLTTCRAHTPDDLKSHLAGFDPSLPDLQIPKSPVGRGVPTAPPSEPQTTQGTK
jgi:hypothetical protein